MKQTNNTEAEGNGKVFIMYYKQGSVLKLDDLYEPLFCGNFPGKASLQYLKDDSGVNISDKNEFYSELTGVYWAWKNTKQAFTGVCHYRRYFTLHPEPWLHRLKYLITHPIKKRIGINPLIYVNNVSKWSERILSFEQAKTILSSHDAILPIPRRFNYSVKTHYKKYHSLNDLTIVESILRDKYPEMLDCWRSVLDGNTLYGNNMFIMKDNYYQEFMEWLFDVLFEFELRVDLNSYEDYQRRILGFISERVTTLWVLYKNLNIKHLQLIYFKNLKKE